MPITVQKPQNSSIYVGHCPRCGDRVAHQAWGHTNKSVAGIGFKKSCRAAQLSELEGACSKRKLGVGEKKSQFDDIKHTHPTMIQRRTCSKTRIEDKSKGSRFPQTNSEGGNTKSDDPPSVLPDGLSAPCCARVRSRMSPRKNPTSW